MDVTFLLRQTQEKCIVQNIPFLLPSLRHLMRYLERVYGECSESMDADPTTFVNKVKKLHEHVAQGNNISKEFAGNGNRQGSRQHCFLLFYQ